MHLEKLKMGSMGPFPTTSYFDCPQERFPLPDQMGAENKSIRAGRALI